MTRAKDRWNSRLTGVSWDFGQIFVTQRLSRDWDRIVDLGLTPIEAQDLINQLNQALDDIPKQAAN